jgi:hypothetical protein
LKPKATKKLGNISEMPVEVLSPDTRLDRRTWIHANPKRRLGSAHCEFVNIATTRDGNQEVLQLRLYADCTKTELLKTFTEYLKKFRPEKPKKQQPRKQK